MANARTRLEYGDDCSEIADDLHRAAGGEGQVIVFRSNDAPWPAPTVENVKPRFNPPFRDSTTFNYPQNLDGSIRSLDEAYHAVYSDGRYVYDGALHNDGIPIGDDTKLVDSMNPNGVGYRLYNPDAGELLKGPINGK
ncbi:hypothetical protein BS333_17025 [Vibrio azureus]|uniref:Uncharacterized protein n=1 Tax=Vibrio azureus NBRC 104587 TaxID=1219077 RepID=U3CHE4_9VIBR|nr:hypothetical protein [Vibrio azureus]AUI88075.1 hypothetical protein BS333_17025 [Vibrio azureus]GAD77673.1 hypothetical protein VAZ01S_085_00190 [Vibrio azureus NBRC 104587]